MKQKILILMSDTGGGHRSAAEAIKAAFEQDYPDRYDVMLKDGIADAAIFPFNHAADWYLPITTYAEGGWGALFKTSNHPKIAPSALRLLDLVAARGLDRLIRDAAPDLVVSVHPLLTTIPRRVLRAQGSRAPFVVVVTDLFDAHRLWFDHDADLLLVPTDGARERAIKYGMPENKIQVAGLPVHLKFLANIQRKTRTREQLELDPQRATILLVGGGEGMGKLYNIARALDRARVPAQLVIIAGRNKTLREKLFAAQWHIPVSIQGFVTNMPDWMRASDVIVTKAGPGTIMEAIACGLPIILSGFLPGQEEGNVTFVEESGVGVLRRKPVEIAHTLREWLAPGNATLEQRANRARELARPRAALEIAGILNAVLATNLPRVNE
jgi:1,2-diacylglycerol 3-beta-galactosyltransferase